MNAYHPERHDIGLIPCVPPSYCLTIPLLVPLHLVVVDRDNDECLASMSSGKGTPAINIGRLKSTK
jgi:hypothetical protein